jgi:hypothetical protein
LVFLAVGLWIWLSDARRQVAQRPVESSTNQAPRSPPTAPYGQAPHGPAPRDAAPIDGASPPPELDRRTLDAAVADHGILKRSAGDEYRSPAGLRYTRGSAEGHRLAHVYRHTIDSPDRPGPHGVFDGGMPGALVTIDDAYRLAQRGGKRVRTEFEDGRTIYTVEMGQRIGFIGGRLGQARRHPQSTRLRLIVDGDRLITAFPV